MRPLRLFIATCVLLIGFRSPSFGHHVVDFLITSTTDPGGQLLINYEFSTTVAPLSFGFSLGTTTVFTGTNPGFDAADGDEFTNGIPAPIFPPGTDIMVELIDNDGGRTAMKLNGVTLSMPGQTVRLGIAANTPPGDLHHHPEWLLFSDHPGGEYAEGLITFRLFSTTPGYLASVPYTLRLTNGHLPPPQFDGAAYDAKSVRCQQAVGAAVDPYVSAVSSLLRRCLDRAAALRARIVAGETADATTRAADRACGAALVAKAEQLRSRAFTAVRKACGADGSKDFSDEIIAQHIGLARCRAEALAAASYFRAQTYLKAFTVNGKTLNQLFPCVLRTSGEEEGRS